MLGHRVNFKPGLHETLLRERKRERELVSGSGLRRHYLKIRAETG